MLFAQQRCFFPCFGDAGGQIYNIYLDNNLYDYLLLDLRCLGTRDDLLLFSTSCPARRRPAPQLSAGAGQVKEVSQRIDQCSCYLLHISMFLCIIILLMHYVFVVQFAVCCYFLCRWYTIPSSSALSTSAHFPYCSQRSRLRKRSVQLFFLLRNAIFLTIRSTTSLWV